MTSHRTFLALLAFLGACGALFALAYFGTRALGDDRAPDEPSATWGVGLAVLFLACFGPGLVGVGLYLAGERERTGRWAWLAIVAGLVVMVVALLAFLGAPVAIT